MSNFGKKPELAWLPLARVSTDRKYQRDTSSRRSQNLIQKIAANFRWSRFGVVLAVKSGQGWHIIDGQHRAEACRAVGITHVPAVVLPHATVAEAAADFVAINRDRVAVTPLHLHHAQLAAGDPIALAIARVCESAGVEICRYPIPSNKMRPGQTLAVATIARLIALHGDERALRILSDVRRESGGAAGAINAAAIREKARTIPLAARNAPGAKGLRPCMSCGVPFKSEGPHNRLCVPCKAAA